jgi:hypothetical protein
MSFLICLPFAHCAHGNLSFVRLLTKNKYKLFVCKQAKQTKRSKRTNRTCPSMQAWQYTFQFSWVQIYWHAKIAHRWTSWPPGTANTTPHGHPGCQGRPRMTKDITHWRTARILKKVSRIESQFISTRRWCKSSWEDSRTTRPKTTRPRTTHPIKTCPTTTRPTTSRPTDNSPHGHLAPRTFRPTDISPHGQFAPRTFRPTDISPHGHFAPRTFCPTDISPHGQLAPWTTHPMVCMYTVKKKNQKICKHFNLQFSLACRGVCTVRNCI